MSAASATAATPTAHTITAVRTRIVDVHLGAGAGTDAVHTSSCYGYAVAELDTSSSESTTPSTPAHTGSGLAFTLGGGTNLVTECIRILAQPLVGRDVEALMAEFGAVFRSIADETQYRWLGPHKGVVHLALAAIVNACWDLWAKVRGQPLWQLLLDLSPEQLVAALDFSYCEDVLSEADALEMLTREGVSRAGRAKVIEKGYTGYDTSFGWMAYDNETIRRQAHEAVHVHGFRALKLKVGSKDPTRDVARARLVRDAVGPDTLLMLDCNQQWTVPGAIAACEALAEVKPFFIEEPTHPDDVAGHLAIAGAVRPLGMMVAAGEAMPNRVVAKNFMAAGAVDVMQTDPTRQGGVSECIVIAMMARKLRVRIMPHVGDMGQISQHLVLFNHVALGCEELFLEHIPHLRAYFAEPATVERGVYVTPRLPGASTALVPDAEGLAAKSIAAARAVADAAASAAAVAGGGTSGGGGGGEGDRRAGAGGGSVDGGGASSRAAQGGAEP